MTTPALRPAFDLSDDDAAALEARMASSGGACQDHALLAGYYNRRELDDASAAAQREAHLLWLAAHCPRHDQSTLFTFFDATPAALIEAWRAHVAAHPDDADILGNAAALLRQHDDAGALALYARAEAAAPTDPRWPEAQARIYSLRVRFGASTRDEDAAMTYAKLQRTVEISDKEARQDLLDDLAEAAWEAGDTQAARAHASAALARAATPPRNWNTGNLIHNAHATLGRMALAEGDLVGARAHLLEAGRTPGSPQLDTFGPDLRLATAMLAHGEHATVLAYLDLCARFWHHAAELDAWRAQLRRGETPELDRSEAE